MLIPSPGQDFPIGIWCKKLIKFDCSCGGNIVIPWRRFAGFKTAKTCGKCLRGIPVSVLPKYGHLIYVGKNILTKGSHRKEPWLCDCGKTKMIRVKSVLSGIQTKCGDCSLMPPKWWEDRLFGRLKIKNPISAHTGSEQKVDWDCLCGSVTNTMIQSVTHGNTSSCGFCSVKIKKWYETNMERILLLKYPISPDKIPIGGIILLEEAKNSYVPVKCMCALCSRIYYPRFNDIKYGKSLTCGCSTNRISKGHVGVKTYVESLGFTVIDEHKLFGFKYDMFVPDRKLLIEFNGEKWHSTKKVMERDSRKYFLARNNEYSLLLVTDQEWNKHRILTKENVQKALMVV